MEEQPIKLFFVFHTVGQENRSTTIPALTMSSKANEEKPSAGAEEDSDVEIEGIDMEGIGEEQADGDDGDSMDVDQPEQTPDDKLDAEQENQDAEELEEARRERLELLESEKQKEEESAVAEQKAPDMGSKLEYLVQQSDVFAHFLAGTVAAGEKKKKGKSASSGRGTKKGRMTEAEEDEQLLKTASSKRRYVRLDKQPSILAKTCKMHAYQMEGLNWLIKLHDHGINGILADEVSAMRNKMSHSHSSKSQICFFFSFLQSEFDDGENCHFHDHSHSSTSHIFSFHSCSGTWENTSDHIFVGVST